MKVFPAPFNVNLNIKMNKESIYDIELFDLTGRSVKVVSGVEGQNLILKRDNLPAGNYILTVKSSNSVHRKNVVIK